MLVPGSNLFKLAASVQNLQTVAYHHFLKRETNAIGLDIAKYAPARTIKGSWQPASRSLIKELGLEWQKKYFVLYAAKDILDVQRDVSGDQISFCGEVFQVLSTVGDWFGQDGWTGVIAVQIPGKDAR